MAGYVYGATRKPKPARAPHRQPRYRPLPVGGEGDREALLYPYEVAALFHVSVKTIGAWARAGKIPHYRTPGGHARFKRAEIAALLEAQFQERMS